MSAIVNVCGPGNSGTTILHLMLGSGNDAFACGEVGKWYRLARYREGVHLPPSLNQFEDTPEENFHAQVLQAFGVDYVIDSSKGIDWIIDTHRWASKHGLKVFNLLMWKHPVDQAHSRWKRNDFDRWYEEYIRYYENFFFRSGLDFFTVSYDELVAEPAGKLKLICRHIGMPYFEGKEHFWEENHSHAGGNEGVRDQLDAGTTRIEKRPHKPGYESYARRVRQRVNDDERLRKILNLLRQSEVSSLPIPESPDAHQHAPNTYQYLWHNLRNRLVSPALRIRWNWIEPNVMQPFRNLRKRLGSE